MRADSTCDRINLLIECAIVAALLSCLILGGTVTSSSVPIPWGNLLNPNGLKQQTSLNSLAMFYNATLGSLYEANYSNVAENLATISLQNLPGAVSSAASSADRAIGEMNASIPLAIAYLGNGSNYFALKEYRNASLAITSGCNEAQSARAAFSYFAYTSTPALASLNVSVSLYSANEDLVNSTVVGVMSTCNTLVGELSTVTTHPGTGRSGAEAFLISSPETSIQTGGNVTVTGNLSTDGVPVAEQLVSFYFNGTFIGSAYTSASGKIAITLRIPYVYMPFGVIWGGVGNNATSALQAIASNALDFTILFNGTQIVIGDPPAYLPTEVFSVNGNLDSVGGTALPGAPVTVSFLNYTVNTSTNASGIFSASFAVPSNATDGIYVVQARFLASGVYGPAYNFTTIQVIHELINLTLSKPKLALAGFGTTVSGLVQTSNGSAVPYAPVVFNFPWGSFTAKSNASGWFSADVDVPVYEFGLSARGSISVAPIQPYIASSSSSTSLPLFNFLWVVLPAVVFGAAGYELRNLRFRSRKPSREVSAKEVVLPPPIQVQTEVLPVRAPSKLGILYASALNLFLEIHPIELKKSATIREIATQVNAFGADSWRFAEISVLYEQFLYSMRSPSSKDFKKAEEDLAELKVLWEQK